MRTHLSAPAGPLGGGGGRRQAGSAAMSHLLSEVIAVFLRPEQTPEITQHVFLRVSVFPSHAPLSHVLLSRAEQHLTQEDTAICCSLTAQGGQPAMTLTL